MKSTSPVMLLFLQVWLQEQMAQAEISQQMKSVNDFGSKIRCWTKMRFFRSALRTEVVKWAVIKSNH